MWFHRKQAIAALVLCGLVPHSFSAQKTVSLRATPRVHASQHHASTLTADDGLSVIAAALDLRVRSEHERDCSHLVNAIYIRAGFPYPYASSSDLYDGTDYFRRVKHPQPGDLVVWTGHVGIVVNPAQHLFFSVLSDGPGIDTYKARYWKRRGPVRFYRYVKGVAARDAGGPG